MTPIHGPVLDAGLVEYPPGATLEHRLDATYELVWVLQGRARWTWGQVRRSLEPGRLLLLRPGMHSRFVWDPARRTRHAWIEFDLGARLDGLDSPETWPLDGPLIAGGPLEALCDYVVWLAAGDPGADAHRREAEALGLAVSMFVRGPAPGPIADDRFPGPIARAVDHVRRVWESEGLRPVGVDELAAVAAVSRGHLSRLFLASVGVGPVSAFERIRLARAAAMLRRTDLTVQAVGRACGFGSPYHFSRRFRAGFGVPPSVHRRTHGRDRDPIATEGLGRLDRALWSGPLAFGGPT